MSLYQVTTMIPANKNNPPRPAFDEARFKKKLLSALSSIRAPGSFASFEELPQLPPARLYVEGVGPIALPLSELQARELITKACQAPYGKGSETIVDTTVRNTWELDPKQFTFRNPRWPNFIHEICSRIAVNLGINVPITAQIYKMLIYEKGAMFKAHTDTEKIPGMFGTLVVCLPSEHQGGEVVVKHGGQTKTFKTSQAAQSFAAWYSDVSHEVLPVTSGFRWVLTYNLAIDPTKPRPSAALPQVETQSLRRILKSWVREKPRANTCLYHVLDHNYTEAHVSLRALKTRDLAQAQVLNEVCKDLSVELFLVLLEKKEIGECDGPWESNHFRDYEKEYGDDYGKGAGVDKGRYHAITTVMARNFAVKALISMEGRVVSENLVLNQNNILQKDCFEGLDVKEEYEGYMGNSGPTATHWYRRTAVVIVPHDSLPAFFNSSYATTSDNNLQEQIRYLGWRCLQPKCPKFLITTLITLCENRWRVHKANPSSTAGKCPISGDGIELVLKAMVQNGEWTFFEKAARHHQGVLPLDFFEATREGMDIGNAAEKARFDACEKGLSSAISSYPYFVDQFRAVRTVVPVLDDTTPDYLQDWTHERLRLSLDSCASKSLGYEDGDAMADLAFYLNQSSDFFSQSVAPVIDRKREDAAFFLAFLARIQQQEVPLGNTIQLYRTWAKSFISSVDFVKMHSGATDDAVQPIRKVPERRMAVSPKLLADFFSGILQSSTESNNLVTLFASKLTKKVPQLLGLELHTLWVPFLLCLIPILSSNNIHPDTPYCEKLFSTILPAYVSAYVGPKPTNIVQDRVDCDCRNCQRLNAFLADPTESFKSFPLFSSDRAHMHQMLDISRIQCSHTTRRSREPQTLVVTKKSHNATKLIDWNTRSKRSQNQIHRINKAYSELLLGQNNSNSTKVEHDSGGSSRPAVAGVKRKFSSTELDVIDLTSD